MSDTLLVIEDEDLLATELARHYRRDGWEVEVASTIAEAEALLLEQPRDPLVVISDMSLPDGNALNLLERVRGLAYGGEWILLTGFGSIPDSVRALRLGAYDFLEKPCPVERLDLVVAGAARSARAQRRIRDQAAKHNRRFSPQAFVGSSAAAQEVRRLLARLAAAPISVLVIGGETGTGKSLAARILHYSGDRSEGPLIEVNCASIPESLLESELFGHEPGAFTGARGRHRGLIEQANRGTLFLDEIGEMTLPVQAKLLRAIEDRRIRRVGGEREFEIDVQILTASNLDLEALVEQERFRSDLFHRLSVFRLELPPLRERREDLEDLVPLMVSEFNSRSGKAVRVVPEEVWRALQAYDWPGNVRELRNVIERCVLFAEDERLPASWLQLPAAARTAAVGRGTASRPELVLPLDGSMSIDEMEREIIEAALEATQGNVTAAARLLGTTRETLRYRVQKYELDRASG